jgi:hypothetical protein
MGSMDRYKIFIQTALTAATFSLGVSNPTLATLINSKADLSIFICSFAWMFVISYLISILMFGRERRRTIQFIASLELTGSALLSLLHLIRLDLSKPYVLPQPFTLLLRNVFFAFSYLALPFTFMAVVDLGLMKKSGRTNMLHKGERKGEKQQRMIYSKDW